MTGFIQKVMELGVDTTDKLRIIRMHRQHARTGDGCM